MKLLKRVLSWLLVCCLIMGMVPSTVFAAEVVASGTCGENLTWTVDDAGVLTISGTGEMDDYGPSTETVFSPEVSYSNQPWGAHRASITSIVIGAGVTGIGDYAFCNCKSLTEVSIPDTVKRIGMGVFSMDSALKSVTIPEGVVSIGPGAFSRCSAVTEISIPKGIQKLEDYVLYSCSSLTEIVIPAAVTEIGSYAFTYNSALLSFRVESGNKHFSAADGVLYDAAGKTLIAFPGGITGDYTIPDGVTTIGDYAFARSLLTAVVISEDVKSIGKMAFYYSGKLSAVVFQEGITHIGPGSFYGCAAISELNLPNSLISIDHLAFYDCYKLKTVTIPANMSQMGENPFASCSAITSIKVDASNAYFKSENGIFYDKAGKTIFSSVPTLSGTVIIPSGVTTINGYAFSELRDVDEFVLPEGVTTIGEFAFNKCAYADVNIPSTVRVISKSAFYDCSFYGNRDIVIPEGVERIEDGIFYGCSFIESVDIPNTVTYLGNQSFAYTNLKSVEIPSSVTSVEFGAFWSCDKMTSVTIPASVTTIADFAFDGCTGLTDIYYGGSEAMWNDISIGTYNDPLSSAVIHYYAVESTSGLQMSAYSDDPDMMVTVGENIQIVCKLTKDGETVSDWDTPVWAITAPDKLAQKGWERLEDGSYCLTFRGLDSGVTRVTITDAESGACVFFKITVHATDAEPWCGYITEVPHFYPEAIGDRDTLTNIYNCSGLYVTDFPYAEDIVKTNGEYNLSFTVYNARASHGSVDVYDKNGNWIQSYRIEKDKNPESVWEVAKNTFFLIKDTVEGDMLSFTAASYSASTNVSITVPEGGFFTISNNLAESPGAFIYNSVDFFMLAAKTAISIGYDAADLDQIQCKTIEKIISNPTAREAFLNSFAEIASKISEKALIEGYGEVISALMEYSFDFLGSLGLDFWSIVDSVCGVTAQLGVDAFLKLVDGTGISTALKAMFSMSKAADVISQSINIAKSEDNAFVMLYTPQGGQLNSIYGVSVEAEQGVIDEAAVLQIFRVSTEDTASYTVHEGNLRVVKNRQYNICFVKENLEIQPKGKVQVRIPMPEDFTEDNCHVLHQQEDGTWLLVDSQIINGLITFEVDHFSLFAIVEIDDTPEEIGVTRIFGATRYDTAFKAADQLKVSSSKSSITSWLPMARTSRTPCPAAIWPTRRMPPSCW